MTRTGRKRILALLFLCFLNRLVAEDAPNGVPSQYRRLFFQHADRRSYYEKALNTVGLTSLPVGRSYAVILGVTQYPNFPGLEQSLTPAAVDLEKLKLYLRDQEFFDEIVVLKDGDMNLENLNYFLQVYFPDRLKNSPHSRFLFAYSGHGYADGFTKTARGFLLTSAATSKMDITNRIDLAVVRALLAPDIDSAEKSLVLINSCQSGAFLERQGFGPNPLGPGDRGAHAIVASRITQQSLGLSSVGPGSVFFEKMFAGLGGPADKSPPDGVVTYHELYSYLRSEVETATNGSQIPMEGDISRDGSVGEFFFLNRSRQIQAGNAKPWDPGSVVAFGGQGSEFFDRGNAAQIAGHFKEAFEAYQEGLAAGNTDSLLGLGSLYEFGYGVAQDCQQSRKWYERAALAGNAYAMLSLGRAYNERGSITVGCVMPLDYGLARKWYLDAAATGNGIAMSNLSYLYEAGHGVPQDCRQALEWLQKGAAAGYASAMFILATKYDVGYCGIPDHEQARQWYQRAADAGMTQALDKLNQTQQ